MQKVGQLGTFASILGQEGGEVGLAYAIKDLQNIWLVQSFRETAVLVARGVPMANILRYWGGYELGSSLKKEMKILPVSIPIGSQNTHAAGIARSLQIKGEKGVVFSFFGDGASSEGETMEAMNYAGVYKAPVIFFCQNNQWAISTPRAIQTAAQTIAQKAIAFGFDGVQVDGNDAFAVYRVVKQAVQKALDGGGPTFIEALTYRIDHHTTSDDWHRYRSAEEVEVWKHKGPIVRLYNYMMKKGIWNEEHEKGLLEDARKKVEEAVKEYEATPKPKVAEVFDYTYGSMPANLQEQKQQWLKFWGEQ